MIEARARERPFRVCLDLSRPLPGSVGVKLHPRADTDTPTLVDAHDRKGQDHVMADFKCIALPL